jgi:integrase/recombinase XerD
MSTSTALVAVPAIAPAVTRADTDHELIELWLFGKSEHTQRAYGADVAEFLAYVGRPLATARLEDLHGFAAHLQQRDCMDAEGKPLARSSYTRKLAAVKSLLSFAQRTGYLQYNVGAAVRLPKVPRRLAERILPLEAVLRTITLEEHPRNRALLRTLYNLGVRVSEVSALKVRDLAVRTDPKTGLEAAQATVVGKGEKERVLLITPGTWAEIRPLVEGRAPDEPVFRSRKGGGPLDPSWILRLVRRAARRAGLQKPVSPHWFRHAHASHALDAGAPIHLVQRDLGHESLATTSQYTHARPDQASGQYLPI